MMNKIKSMVTVGNIKSAGKKILSTVAGAVVMHKLMEDEQDFAVVIGAGVGVSALTNAALNKTDEVITNILEVREEDFEDEYDDYEDELTDEELAALDPEFADENNRDEDPEASQEPEDDGYFSNVDPKEFEYEEDTEDEINEPEPSVDDAEEKEAAAPQEALDSDYEKEFADANDKLEDAPSNEESAD